MFRKFIQFILVDVWSNQSIVIQMREEMFEPVPNDPKRRNRYSTFTRPHVEVHTVFNVQNIYNLITRTPE